LLLLRSSRVTRAAHYTAGFLNSHYKVPEKLK
jgi:hypothetical protein